MNSIRKTSKLNWLKKQQKSSFALYICTVCAILFDHSISAQTYPYLRLHHAFYFHLLWTDFTPLSLFPFSPSLPLPFSPPIIPPHMPLSFLCLPPDCFIHPFFFTLHHPLYLKSSCLHSSSSSCLYLRLLSPFFLPPSFRLFLLLCIKPQSWLEGWAWGESRWERRNGCREMGLEDKGGKRAIGVRDSK